MHRKHLQERDDWDLKRVDGAQVVSYLYLEKGMTRKRKSLTGNDLLELHLVELCRDEQALEWYRYGKLLTIKKWDWLSLSSYGLV